MKVAVISGSNRTNSGSLRVSKFLKSRIDSLTKMESEIIDLHTMPFSISPDDNYGGKQDVNFRKISEKINACDALIIVSPEWAGCVPPILKALLIFIGKPAAYKPGLLVGVSAGRGGSFPINELKSSGNKNNFISFLPEYLIFRDVNTLFKSDIPQGKDEEYIHHRSDYAVKLLEEFAKAYQTIRNSGAVDLNKYPYGM